MSSRHRAVFLDRDGVINQRPPEGFYITSVEDMQLLPGVVDAIGRLNRAGYLVIVVTNQRCIARGIASAEAIAQIHEHLMQLVEAGHAKIDHIYVCPHNYADDCACRKPKPGMLLEAATTYDLDLPRCWMVGDSRSDVDAGRAAGCRTIFVGPASGSDANAAAPNLLAAVETILAA